ncbi:Putative Zinc finger, ZZ-type, SANT/Myb domain, SWIRM domain, Homeobox-like domain superfamily [Septoria linicola]|uniref:Transcriptional adapter 2 n=1 Tax=Septoria linicola TaxID=215465 RepID=A0A9Q9AZ81_9PEZI|nr:putative Zinc finger, ZZ-type, SANT/Myb domain, SWIRM domain, Homeobox-like domain superfamily [Septoria linicola]USW54582.1 Putative Zinc finger, ZZ-type, SANT/Myb domain, SWIRM domain, Homeobox-like domain superfamily [Septoria linicola]
MGLITKAKGAPKSEGGSAGGGVKTICDVCSNDITATVRIRCASKSCNDYDLCVPCFSQGKANLHHDPRTHAYQVIEPHSIPIFDEGWGADEELLLLEGAEQYGLGSFADMADHIGGYREKDEVRDHYIETYVNSSKFPLPERADPKDKRLSEAVPREEFQQRKKRRIDERKQAREDQKDTAPTPAKPTSSVPSCHEVAGFMPGRLEFENEYFNEAEEAVQHMQFSPEEGINPATKQFDPETELKMVVMTIYNDRLTARTDRKKIIFNHRLLNYKENVQADKRRTKEQRDLHHKVKPFARIMSHPNFVTFAADLETEHNLRQAIIMLQEWRRMRISTLAHGEKYEKEKAARAARSFPLPGQFDRLTNGIRPKAGDKDKGVPEVATAVHEYTTQADLPIRLPTQAEVAAKAESEKAKSEEDKSKVPTRPEPPKHVPLPPIPGLAPANWDEEQGPDWQLLQPAEKDLCNKLRLHPKAYNCIKDAVLREAMKYDGKLKKKNVREISKIDTTKGGRVFEFLVESGWISNAAKA